MSQLVNILKKPEVIQKSSGAQRACFLVGSSLGGVTPEQQCGPCREAEDMGCET